MNFLKILVCLISLVSSQTVMANEFCRLISVNRTNLFSLTSLLERNKDVLDYKVKDLKGWHNFVKVNDEVGLKINEFEKDSLSKDLNFTVFVKITDKKLRDRVWDYLGVDVPALLSDKVQIFSGWYPPMTGINDTKGNHLCGHFNRSVDAFSAKNPRTWVPLK